MLCGTTKSDITFLSAEKTATATNVTATLVAKEVDDRQAAAAEARLEAIAHEIALYFAVGAYGLWLLRADSAARTRYVGEFSATTRLGRNDSGTSSTAIPP